MKLSLLDLVILILCVTVSTAIISPLVNSMIVQKPVPDASALLIADLVKQSLVIVAMYVQSRISSAMKKEPS